MLGTNVLFQKFPYLLFCLFDKLNLIKLQQNIDLHYTILRYLIVLFDELISLFRYLEKLKRKNNK